MAATVSPSTFTPPESFAAGVRLADQDFTFRLYTRPLRLGSYGTIQYYWMDSSLLRDIESEAAAANFRNCVGHWAAAMRVSGLGNDLEQQTHFVTAVCYALVCRSKGMQEVYRDAFLAPRSVNVDADALPDRVRRRIRRIVRARDRSGVQQELDATLGRFELPAKVLPALQEAFRNWVGRGVTLLRQQGTDGLSQFLAEVDYWLAKYRKRSGRWVRHFINLFAHEAKVSFYRCYANAWIDLIPWLREHRQLDLLSERFLRTWHHQNQPIEVPHGRTLGGIYYPTRAGAAVIEPHTDGRQVRRLIAWETEHIGPTHVPDVFCGEILALHPLSAFIMKDPALCAIAGRFFASDRYDEVMVQGRAGCAEYWDLVGAILSAAHLYRRAADRQAQRRGVRHRGGNAAEVIASAPETTSEAALLEDFADTQQVKCSRCGGGIRLRQYHAAQPGAKQFQVEYACRTCGRDITITVETDVFTEWLLAGE